MRNDYLNGKVVMTIRDREPHTFDMTKLPRVATEYLIGRGFSADALMSDDPYVVYARLLSGTTPEIKPLKGPAATRAKRGRPANLEKALAKIRAALADGALGLNDVLAPAVLPLDAAAD
jgi:hypothetical protein